MIYDTKNGLILKLRISPNASKNTFLKDMQGLKVKITAQPVDGKANKALIEFLSEKFKIPKSSFEILKGTSTKDKTILITNISDEKKQYVKEMLSFAI